MGLAPNNRAATIKPAWGILINGFFPVGSGLFDYRPLI
jgi:hypothetical protein